jgi:signal transduction histidine kinase/CheY-like chemotaxis protein
MRNDFNIDNLPIPLIIIRSSNFEIQHINDEAIQILHLSNNEIIGKNFIDLIEQKNTYYADIKDTNTQQFFEDKVLRFKAAPIEKLSKTEKLYLLTAKPLDESNTLTIIQVIEQSKVNINNDNYQRVNNALNTSNIGIFEYNPNTSECYFSDSFLALLQISPHENNSWAELEELVFPEDVDSFAAFFLHHKQYGIPLNFDFRVELNNEVQWFNLNGENANDCASTQNIMGTLTNCTHEKLILHKLNNAIESKNIVMKVGNIGTWGAELNESGEWDWSWDHIANDMFELEATDIGNGSLWSQRLHPEDKSRVFSTIQTSLETGCDFSSKYRALLPNNKVKYFLGEGIVGLDVKGNVTRIDGLCVDETERISAQLELKELNSQLEKRVLQRTDELNKAKRKAEQASQIKSDFLSMMSHELRTPMNAIIGSLDLLQTTGQTGEPAELIDTAKLSAENLVLILNDILDISKIEAGKMIVEESQFCISSLLDNIVHVFLPVAQEKKIVLSVEEDPEIDEFLLGDSARLRQILFNLISNAVKFSASDSNYSSFVSVKVKLKKVINRVSTVSFEITDNGIGINKKNQKSLFKPFTQAEESTTRKYGGTGLGLSICDQLTKLMSGEITLISEINQGSTFTATFPFKRDNEYLSNSSSRDEQHDLAGKYISICSTYNKQVDKFLSIGKLLDLAGCITSFIKFNDYNNQAIDADVFIVYIHEFSIKVLDKLTKFYPIKLSLSNTLILCSTANLREIRPHFPQCKVMAYEPLTKTKLLKTLVDIQKTVEKDSLLLNFDDLDLGELDFSTEIPAMESVFIEKEIVDEQDKKILVVEDNELNQKLIKKQLVNLGFPCDLAINGEEGKSMWEVGNYEIILTDCHMPKLDGYEMTKKIRTLEKEQNKISIPIVAVTGAAMTGDDQKCFDAGMSDFISKPIKLVDLNKVLNKWLHHE